MNRRSALPDVSAGGYAQEEPLSTDPHIRLLRQGEAEECERIMSGLPQWFGIPSAIADYRRALDSLDTYVVLLDGRIAGFMALKPHMDACAEIIVMAVRRECHRRGLGRSLVDKAEEWATRRAMACLSVKTLGPSRPDAHYAMTRRFYEAMGFCPIEETDLWGERNPCLIMVKHLACGRVQGGTLHAGLTDPGGP